MRGLLELFERLASTAPHVQALLQVRNARTLQAFERSMKDRVPLDHPLARAVAPKLVRLERTSIELDLHLSVRRERRLGLDLVFLGRTVTSFLEVVHRESVSREMHVKFTVEDVTTHPEPTPHLVFEEERKTDVETET